MSTALDFEGFERAGSTAVPDVIFDLLLSLLSGSELKVLLYIIRRTFGFGKILDAISLTQFEKGITTRDGRVLDKGAGLNRGTIIKALQSLVSKGIIKCERQGQAALYGLRFKGEVVGNSDQSDNATGRKSEPVRSDNSTSNVPELVGILGSTGRKIPLEVVGKSDPQETVQATVLQQTDTNSNSFTPPSTDLSQKIDQILGWAQELGIYGARDTRRRSAEELVPHIHSKEQLKDLHTFGKTKRSGTVWLGNLPALVSEWLQSQITEVAPAPSAPVEDAPYTDEKPLSEAAHMTLVAEIGQTHTGLIFDEYNGFYVGIRWGDQGHQAIPVESSKAWRYDVLVNSRVRLEQAIHYGQSLRKSA